MFNPKTNRLTKVGISVLTLSLISIALISGVSYLPTVKAFTNGIVFKSIADLCSSQSTCTITSQNSQINDLLLVYIYCTDSNTAVTSITDGSSDAFTKVVGSFIRGGGIPLPTASQASLWFSSAAKASTTGTITINLSQTSTHCMYAYADVNVGGTLLADISSASYELASAGTITASSKTYNQGPNTYFVSIIGTSAVTCGFNPDADTGNSPLVSEQTLCFNSFSEKVSMFDSFQASAFLGTLSVSHQQFNNNDQGITYVTAAFNTTGNGSTCSGSTTAIVGTTTKNAAAVTVSMLSNTTYMTFGSTTNPELVTDILLNVSAIALTNGQHNAKLTLAVYTGNTFFPTVSNPLTLLTSGTFVFTVTNAGTRQIIKASGTNAKDSLAVSISNTVFAIAMGVSHDGVTLFTGTGATFFTDSSDVFSSGVVPNKITTTTLFVGANAQLNGDILIPCIQTTSSSNTTVTTTGTTIVTSLAGGFQVQGLLNWWPIWMLPLIMGGMFGLIGVFIGLGLGTAIGVLLGIIPSWLVFLLATLLVVIVVRKEI